MIKGNYGAILPNLSRNRNPNIALKLIRAEQLMGASSAMPAARRIFLGSDSSMPGGTVTKGWGGGGGLVYYTGTDLERSIATLIIDTFNMVSTLTLA